MLQVIKKPFFYFILFFITGVFFIIDYKFSYLPSHKISNAIFNSTVTIKQGIGYLAQNIRKIRSSFATNATLKKRIASLEQRILDYEKNYKSIESMNYQINQLQKMLGFTLNREYELLPAFIYAQDSKFQQRYLLNRGWKNNVRQDLPVFAIYQNQLVLVGRILKSYSSSAIFVTINDENFIIPVITEETNQIGILYGNGDSDNTMTFELDSISGTEQVFVGETVLVNEFSLNYPPEIPLGKIIDLTHNREKLLITATVKPYVNVQSIDKVFILLFRE